MRWYRLTIGEGQDTNSYAKLARQELSDYHNYSNEARYTFSPAHKRKYQQQAATAYEKYQEYSKLASDVSEVVFQSYTTYPRYENRTPVNVEFECSSYIDTRKTSSTRLFTTFNLRLYSQSIALFTALRKYEGKILHFEAGFDRESEFVKKLGYNVADKNFTIFRGNIAGITGTFTYDNNYINITNAVTRPHFNSNHFKWKLVLTQGDKLFSGNIADVNTTNFIQTQKKQGRSIYNSISEALSIIFNLTDPFLKVYTHPNLKDVMWDKPYDKVIYYTSFESLSKQLSNLLGIKMSYMANKGVAIYPLQSYKEAIEDSGYDVAKARSIEAKLFNECINQGTASNTTTIPIALSELVVQPTLQGYAGGTVSITSILKPQISVGSTISLPSSGVYTEMGGEFQDPSSMGNYLEASVVNKIPITAKGNYIVSSVTHKGSFYDQSQTAWATIMECIPENMFKQEASK